MDIEQKEILRYTLMALSSNFNNIRSLTRNSENKFSQNEVELLNKIEQKMDELKSSIVRALLYEDEILEHRKKYGLQSLFYDNVD